LKPVSDTVRPVPDLDQPDPGPGPSSQFFCLAFLCRDGYLIPLHKPLKSTGGGRHLDGDLKLFNECFLSHNGETTSINDEFAYLTSSSTLGVEDLLPLVRFRGKLFGIKDSSNHQ